MNKTEQQLKHNDCGISAVKIIYNLHNIPVNRQFIEENIFLTEEGSSLNDIKDFLDKQNLTATFNLLDLNTFKFNPEKLSAFLPCILPVKSRQGQHYVVIQEVKNNKLLIADPAKGALYKWGFGELMRNAHTATATYDYVSNSQLLQQIVNDDLQNYGIAPVDVIAYDQAEILNKLTYLSYLKENFGFADAAAEKRFLHDLLFNQTIEILPRQFKNLKLNKEKLKITAPVVLTVQKPAEFKLPVSNAALDIKPPNAYKRLFKELKPYHKLWGIYITAALFAAFIAQLTIFSNQILIDNVLPSYNLNILILFAIGLGLFRLFDLVLSIYKSFISIHLANVFDHYFLTSFIDKLNSFSIRYTQSYSKGDLTERVKDSLQLKTFFISFFTNIMIDGFVTIYSLFILFIINWKIALIVVAVLVIFVIWYFLVTPYVQDNEKRRFLEKSNMFSSIFENIDGLQVVKSFRLEGLFMQRLAPKIKSILDIQKRVKYVNLVNSGVINIVITIAGILILVFLSRNAILTADISVGQIITFLALSRQVFGAVSSLLDENLDLQENYIILHRYFDFNEHNNKPQATVNLTEINKIKNFSLDTIAFTNVGFHYIPQRPVFSNLNTQINKGDKIRLEGSNGAGKSTFCKVLSLLYETDTGEILINQQRVGFYNKAALREKILLVSNDDIMFNDTLGYNLSFSYTGNIHQILDLAKAIGLYDFIAEKPEGLDFIIYEQGRNLSTGQRKKILMMRALLSDAELIILDETLSGIDSESKEKIERYMNALNDRSFIIISHEPLNVLQFTKILKMQNGTIEQLQLPGV